MQSTYARVYYAASTLDGDVLLIGIDQSWHVG